MTSPVIASWIAVNNHAYERRTREFVPFVEDMKFMPVGSWRCVVCRGLHFTMRQVD